MRAAVRELERLTPPFNWQREYAPLWEGRNEGHLNDILFGPEDIDVLTINGVTAPWWYHQMTARKGRVQ